MVTQTRADTRLGFVDSHRNSDAHYRAGAAPDWVGVVQLTDKAAHRAHPEPLDSLGERNSVVLRPSLVLTATDRQVAPTQVDVSHIQGSHKRVHNDRVEL